MELGLQCARSHAATNLACIELNLNFQTMQTLKPLAILMLESLIFPFSCRDRLQENRNNGSQTSLFFWCRVF